MDNQYQELIAEAELVESTNSSRQDYCGLKEEYIRQFFYERYPNIFVQKKFFRGIECGPGWFGLVDEMCFQIDKICRDNPGFKVCIDLIKEKFGSMRVQGVSMYSVGCEGSDGSQLIEAHEGLSDMIWKVIETADKKSSTVCDICGEPGEVLSSGGWLRARCDRHAK
jgi:hypothetical protein